MGKVAGAFTPASPTTYVPCACAETSGASKMRQRVNMELHMLSHVTLGVHDVPGAGVFYDGLLAALGYIRLLGFDSAIGYGAADDEHPAFWVCLPFDGHPASVGNGTHVAFVAPDRDSVDAFHRQALATGGSDEGGPGLRPHYHANYYAAYVRDPEGNKLQAVCHAPG